MTAPPPLEDDFADVLGKALRGTGRDPAALGVDAARVEAVLAGEFDADVVRALAAALDLAPERVVALGEGGYVPAPVSVEGLAMFTTPFDAMTVNAYLVADPATGVAAAFDTGGDADPILAFARERGLRLTQVFLTHGHGDHIYDLDRLVEKTHARAWAPRDENIAGAEPFAPGATFSIGGLRVETRLTRGHSPGGVTYVVRGLERPIAICGDAVFAGSMGGGLVSYPEALRTSREAIFSLPDETVLASGHGPLTTVGEQRRHNPFFP